MSLLVQATSPRILLALLLLIGSMMFFVTSFPSLPDRPHGFIRLDKANLVERRFVVPVTKRIQNELNFVVLGESGKINANSVEHLQQVAATLKKLSSTHPIEFIVSTGSVFGQISSETDPKVDTVFHIFEAASLQVPWYPVLGVQDCQGNLKSLERIQALHPEWQFPSSRYYTKSYTVTDPHTQAEQMVNLALLDTCTLTCTNNDYPRAAAEQAMCDTMTHNIESSGARKQLSWLERLLSSNQKSNAFQLVVGHHAIHDWTRHTSGQLDEMLSPLFDKFDVLAYFAGFGGHSASAKRTNYFVNGANGDAAMFLVTVRVDSMVVRGLKEDGTELFITPLSALNLAH